MTSWDFWSVISLMGILQAALLLLYFAADKKNYTLPNFFVALLLLWIVWVQTEFLVLRRSFTLQSDIFFGTRHGVWLLLGPLVYHYLLVLFGKKTKLDVSIILHYIPFLTFAIAIPLVSNETIPGRVIDYGMLSVLKFPMLSKGWINTMYGFIFIFQFIHAAVYLGISVKLIGRFQRESSESSSDNRQELLPRLKGVVAAISFFTVTSVLFIGVLLKSQWYVKELDYVYILPLTFCVYLLFFFAVRQQPIPIVTTPLRQRYQQSTLDAETSRQLFETVKKAIEKERLFINPELRLADLSEITNISYHQLSQVINKEAGVSFFEFVNQFRIKEVLTAIERNRSTKINVLEIAFAAGFNNKASFNRYFKKISGKTPTDFIRETVGKA